MATGGDLLHLDQQICFALYAASRATTCAYQPLLEELGVTYPQYLVLLVLWEKDGMRVSQIGERLFLDSATLTPLLKRLEGAGFVTRTRAAGDERQVIIALTPQGRALKSRAKVVPESLLCATGCTVAELVGLKARLEALRTNLMQET